jgi:hypothetical protein
MTKKRADQIRSLNNIYSNRLDLVESQLYLR